MKKWSYHKGLRGTVGGREICLPDQWDGIDATSVIQALYVENNKPIRVIYKPEFSFMNNLVFFCEQRRKKVTK